VYIYPDERPGGEVATSYIAYATSISKGGDEHGIVHMSLICTCTCSPNGLIKPR
jgi:hypothetical protein